MKCISCGANTFLGTTTDVTDVENRLIIVRNVPCHKCSECDEIIYMAGVAKHLEKIATDAMMAVNEIAIVDYNTKVA